jgi:hypothetical protein
LTIEEVVGAMVRMAVDWRGGGGATSIVGGSRVTGGDGGATLEVDEDDGLVTWGQRPRDEDDRGVMEGRRWRLMETTDWSRGDKGRGMKMTTCHPTGLKRVSRTVLKTTGRDRPKHKLKQA